MKQILWFIGQGILAAPQTLEDEYKASAIIRNWLVTKNRLGRCDVPISQQEIQALYVMTLGEQEAFFKSL